MKKITITIIYVLSLAAAHAQKINESEARQYLEKVWSYLKTSDSVAFVNLWLPEDSVWEKEHTSADAMNHMKSFHFLRKWLEPAISQNLDIDHIQIGETNARGTELKAYIKAREHAVIGFSFYVIPVKNKWAARGKPGYFAGTN
jgi:hypothetical protein